MDFVVAAIGERLTRASGRSPGTRWRGVT